MWYLQSDSNIPHHIDRLRIRRKLSISRLCCCCVLQLKSNSGWSHKTHLPILKSLPCCIWFLLELGGRQYYQDEKWFWWGGHFFLSLWSIFLLPIPENKKWRRRISISRGNWQSLDFGIASYCCFELCAGCISSFNTRYKNICQICCILRNIFSLLALHGASWMEFSNAGLGLWRWRSNWGYNHCSRFLVDSLNIFSTEVG